MEGNSEFKFVLHFEEAIESLEYSLKHSSDRFAVEAEAVKQALELLNNARNDDKFQKVYEEEDKQWKL